MDKNLGWGDTLQLGNQQTNTIFGELKEIKFLCVALKLGEYETGAAAGYLAHEEQA